MALAILDTSSASAFFGVGMGEEGLFLVYFDEVVF